MKEIPLTQGKVALVDDEDYDWLNQYKWCVLKYVRGVTVGYYAIRHSRKLEDAGTSTAIYMHRQLLNTPPGCDVDHISGDTLDNRRNNLRQCTNAQNQYNAKKRSGTSSRYKGVAWLSRDRRWKAYITFNGERLYLGFYDAAIEAAQAYDAKAKELFGEFARPNLPD